MASSRLVNHLFIVACICVSTAHAQMHDNAWVRTTLDFSATEKMKIDVELQHRRQNGFENSDMLNKNLLFSARTWIHYQYNTSLRLSASPFACYHHYKPIINKTDESANAAEELRFALAAELRPKITEKIALLYRLSIESRFLNNYPSSILRLRNRLGLQYTTHQKLKMIVYDEFFMNAWGASREHIFDHNRIAVSFEYEARPKLKLEAGYMYITRLPLQAGNMLYENNIFLNVSYTITTFKNNDLQ